MALLEELAFDDPANAQEMKDTKAELSKVAIRSLQKRRREHRADRFLIMGRLDLIKQMVLYGSA